MMIYMLVLHSHHKIRCHPLPNFDLAIDSQIGFRMRGFQQSSPPASPLECDAQVARLKTTRRNSQPGFVSVRATDSNLQKMTSQHG
jgi:hypothetical protein